MLLNFSKLYRHVHCQSVASLLLVSLLSSSAVANEIVASSFQEESAAMVSLPEPVSQQSSKTPTSAKPKSDATAPEEPAANPAGNTTGDNDTAEDLPQAKSVDLAEPISNEELMEAEKVAQQAAKSEEAAVQNEAANGSKKPSPNSAKVPDNSAEKRQANQPSNKMAKDSKPAGVQESAASETAQQPDATPVADADTATDVPVESKAGDHPTADAAKVAKSLQILGTKVPPATSTRLAWSPSQSFEGLSQPTPVLVVNGAGDGPTLCLTAAIHGDELNGIEIVRRALYSLNPEELSGAVIGVPIVNLQGFRRNSRYLADRRDLNRFFPGNATGSAASRIANSFFNNVISHCDALVDLHTGSFDRTNLPQLRADLRNKEIAKLTHNFGATVVLHSEGAEGTLRRAAVERGIPAVTLEAGGPMRLQEEAVSHGVAGIQTLLNGLGMIKKFRLWGAPEPVYYQSNWIRADQGGILFSNVELGQTIKAGAVLGTVTDPITNVSHDIVSPHRGRVLGMALNQVMLPGYAAYHIGIAAPDEKNAVPAGPNLPETEDIPPNVDLSQNPSPAPQDLIDEEAPVPADDEEFQDANSLPATPQQTIESEE